jgi:trimethylamine--corrinoid protein Co-methyltransferase
MGDVGTWLIDCAYTEVGKSLAMPTHAYLGMTDAKVVDAQAGLESAGGALLAALAGVNMVSGAGMMDFESCQSYEKLVIDAEIIGMVKRFVAGIEARESPIALNLMRKMGHKGEFLMDAHTLKWFQQEQYIPSSVIDRDSLDGWKRKGAMTTFERAKLRVEELLSDYRSEPLPDGMEQELHEIALSAAKQHGMDALPARPASDR